MKIAVISSHTPSLFWFRMDMMKRFIDKGHQVIAIGNEADIIWNKKFKDNGIKYIQANVKRNGLNPIDEFNAYQSIKSILNYEKPDKIFNYQAKMVVYASIAAHRLGIKEIYPLIAGLGSVFLKNGLKYKIIQYILKIEYQIGLSCSKKVFFQNKDDVDFFINNRLVKSDKIVMINGSGVNLDRFHPQQLPNDDVFLFIGRLIRDKGLFEYLNAARLVKKEYPNSRFLLVGPFDSNPSAIGPYDLQPFIEDGTIEYFGEQTDVRPYLQQCSVFVLPSYREGTPKTVLEAMACKKAIITSDAPGCRETVIDGLNGYLVPIMDTDVVAEKMKYLINHHDVVIQMAEQGRRIVEDRFDVVKVNNTICETMGI